MADITMTQVTGTTHHYTADIDVEVANLQPSIDLKNALNAAADPIEVPENILADTNLEDIIKGTFVANTASITSVGFLAGSFDPVALTIQLGITTTGGDEADAISMQFEFLHSVAR